MKNLLITILMFVSSMSIASETCQTKTGDETIEERMVISTDVPKFLEGATIIVRTKDGRESSVPAEKFKVVARKQQFLVSKTKQQIKTTCNAKNEEQKNRLSVVIGEGPQPGMKVSRSASEVTVESRVGAIGGIQYQRQTELKIFGLPISVGGQLQNNESALGVVGLDF